MRQKKKSKKRILEKQIQLEICEWLKKEKYFFWRSNNIPVFDKTTGFYRPMPKYAVHGLPDIIIVKDGRFIGIEVKKPGGKLSDNQVKFWKRCVEEGGKYYCVHSLEEAQNLFFI